MSNEQQTPDKKHLELMAKTVTNVFATSFGLRGVLVISDMTRVKPGQEAYMVMALDQDSGTVLDVMAKMGFEYTNVEPGIMPAVKYYYFTRAYAPFVPEESEA